MIGEARLASELADDMLKKGIYVIGFSYPVRILVLPCDKRCAVIERGWVSICFL